MGHAQKRKAALMKMIWLVMCFVLTLGPVICFSGCSQSSPEDAAVEAARTWTQERLETVPYSVGITNPSLEDFALLERDGETYVVEGTVDVTCVTSGYITGSNEVKRSEYLTMTVKETVPMTQDGDGQWQLASWPAFTVTDSSVDDGDGTAIETFDDSDYVSFISREDAGGSSDTLPEGELQYVVKDLMMDFVYQVGTGLQEKTTFSVAGADSAAVTLTPVEVPESRPDALNCWQVEGGVVGNYMGYMDGRGYMLPFFVEDFDAWYPGALGPLNDKPFYLVETADGFSLEPEHVFLGQ